MRLGFHVALVARRRQPAALPVRARAPQSGFTLLEVLIATAILGIAVSAVMSGFSISFRQLSRAQGYERALLLGRQRLNLLLLEDTLRPGRREGRWDDDYRWEAQIEQWSPAGPGVPVAMRPTVAVIHFTVFWKAAGGGEKSVLLETSKYAPDMLKP